MTSSRSRVGGSEVFIPLDFLTPENRGIRQITVLTAANCRIQAVPIAFQEGGFPSREKNPHREDHYGPTARSA